MITKKAVIDLEVVIPDGAECYLDSIVVKYSLGAGVDHIVTAKNLSWQIEWEEKQ